MAKVNRKIPMYVQKARLRDYHINKEYRDRENNKYPLCIGTYPECSNLKIGNICSDCKSCFHFCSKSYKKIIGGNTMKNNAKQIKKEVKRKETRDEKIKKMVENYEHLKPAAKAWLKIWAKQGYVEQDVIERLGLVEVKNEI
jgi:hypothetical protein